MGLDMYLTKKTYIGAEYEHRNVQGSIDIKIDEEPVKIEFKRLSHIEENVGYWRKANQIHNWFVANVQNNTDDCGTYEVSEEQLNSLLAVCKEIKLKRPLIPGTIINGHTAQSGEGFKPNYEEGQLMSNSHIAAKLLPSKPGFFFGSTDYDQYYMEDIDNTIEIIETLLKEKDPGKEYLNGCIYYHSSW